jgi:hypothetical protein
MAYLPYVEDRCLNLDIGSEGGNDVCVAGRTPYNGIAASTRLYGQIQMQCTALGEEAHFEAASGTGGIPTRRSARTHSVCESYIVR